MPTVHFRGDARYPHGSPTLRRYVLGAGSDPARPLKASARPVEIDICQGPVESGKTFASIVKACKLAFTMPRCKDGIRRSKILFWRHTYPELENTVIPDVLELLPEGVYGKMEWTEPATYKVRFADVEADFVFMALGDDSEKTLKKLRSFVCTAAYGNELQYASMRTFNRVTQRTGRYPSRRLCPGYDRKKRHWGDLNAPPVHDHWVLYMRGDTPIPGDMPADQAMAYERPDGWEFYVQPPAVLPVLDSRGEVSGYELNPEAENLQNMGDNPYLPSLGGLPRDEIDRDYRNITRAKVSGHNRYPGFSREKHVARSRLQASPHAPIILGADGGASPAVGLWQHIDGRWYGLGVVMRSNTTATEFVPEVADYIAEQFPFAVGEDGSGVIAWGDPDLGWQAAHGAPWRDIYAKHGITMQSQWRKDRPQVRWETGRRLFSEFPGGEPKILLCPERCQPLITAFENATMRVSKVMGGLSIKEEIVKNEYSHPVEACEYAWCGGGEARETLHNPNREARKGPIDTLAARGAGRAVARGRSWKTLTGAR